MLPLACACAHSLICILDPGYLILAVTYIPANLLLALTRTAIHWHADVQAAPGLFTNIWVGVHLVGPIPGLLTAMGFTEAKTLPVCSPVIVGCFCALWGVVCTVEGPVLKLPLRVRMLGHASILVSHIIAPPMSELGQPSEALIIIATIVIGDLYGTLVEAGLNVVRTRAFVAGQQHERHRLATTGSKRVGWRDGWDQSTPLRGGSDPPSRAQTAMHTPTSSEATAASETKAQRVAMLNAMISESSSLAALALDAPEGSIPANLHAGLYATGAQKAATASGDGIDPLGTANPSSLVAGLGGSEGGSEGEAAAAARDSKLTIATVIEDWLHLLNGGDYCEPVIDEAAFQAFSYRRMLPVHLLLSCAWIVLMSSVPEDAIALSPTAVAGICVLLALQVSVRIAQHQLLSPERAHYLAARVSFGTTLSILLFLGSIAPPTIEVTSPTSRTVLACMILMICGSMHACTLPSSWRAVLVTTSCLHTSPNWPSLDPVDRMSIWVVMHVAALLISHSVSQYLRQCFRQEALVTSPLTSSSSSAPSSASPMTALPPNDTVTTLPPNDTVSKQPTPPPPPTPTPSPLALAPAATEASATSAASAPPTALAATALAAQTTRTPFALAPLSRPLRVAIPQAASAPCAADTVTAPSAETAVSSSTDAPAPFSVRNPVPPPLGVVALKPHALGKLPGFPSATTSRVTAAVRGGDAAATRRSGRANPDRARGGGVGSGSGGAPETDDMGLRKHEEWQSKYRLHVTLMIVRAMIYLIVINSFTLKTACLSMVIVAIRLGLRRVLDPSLACKLYQVCMVGETWLAVLISIYAEHETCKSVVGGLSMSKPLIAACSRRSPGAQCAFLGWQVLYPFHVANQVR